MNVKIVPSEYTPGAWWIYAEYVPKEGKLSKSEKPSQWYLVSSWGSRESV